MIVTKQYIENYIQTRSTEQVAHFIGRALVVLFNNQTESEKAQSTTNVDNGVGFTGADGHSGCITAKYYLKHRTLLDWQIEKWTKPNCNGTMRISKYHTQLNEAAKLKATPATPRSWKQVNTDLTKRKRITSMAEVERTMKDMHAAYEREQEAEAFMRKEMVRDRATTIRRSIRNKADQRSL